MLRNLLAVIIFLSAGAVFAQEGTDMISEGKKVKLDYKLTIEGKVVDSTEDKEPLEYVHGQGMIIPGLEKELSGMKKGESKHITVPPNEAYGQVNENAIMEIPKTSLPQDTEPKTGMMIQASTQDGRAVVGVIQEVRDDNLVVNFNHPLAGEELTFDVKVVEIGK